MPGSRSQPLRQIAAAIEARLDALPQAKVEPIRRIRRDISLQLADAQPKDIVSLAFELLERDGWPARLVAYELVSHHPHALAGLRRTELERLGRDLDSWGAVDTFACYLSGPAWRDGQISDAVVHQWAARPTVGGGAPPWSAQSR